MKTRNKVACVLAALTLAGSAASASPTFTSINNTSGEVNQATLLSVIYGGAWTRLTGTQSYTNGSLTAFRVADDGLSSPLHIVTGNRLLVEDDIWAGGETTVTVRAKYAADSHTFGWINGSSGTSGFQPLFSTTNFDNPIKVALTNSFRWALHNESSGHTFTSKDSNNPGNRDMMVTYSITGAGITAPTWLLAWEDRTSNSDRDFNDAAIEISTAQPIPEPGPMVLASMAGLFIRRRRR